MYSIVWGYINSTVISNSLDHIVAIMWSEIDKAMNDRMETGKCFLRPVSIEKTFLKKAKTYFEQVFHFICQECKEFNADSIEHVQYFHASSSEKYVIKNELNQF